MKMNISAAHIEDGAGTRDFPGPFGAGRPEGLCMTPGIRGVGPVQRVRQARGCGGSRAMATSLSGRRAGC